MSNRQITPFKRVSDQMGRPSPWSTTNCLWGDCRGTGPGVLPPAGYVLNQTTGQTFPAWGNGDSSGATVLPDGHYIDSSGYEFDIPDHTSPIGSIKQPPLAPQPGRYPGIHFMPGGGRIRQGGTMPTADPDVPDATPPVSVVATPTAADDGLIFGYEPTTLLWIGGGVLASIIALAYLPAIIPTGGKK